MHLLPVGREPSAAAPTHLLRGGVAAWVPVVTVPGETRWGLDRHRRASSDAVISPRRAEVHKTPRLCNSFALTLEALFGRFDGKAPTTELHHRAIRPGTDYRTTVGHELNPSYLPPAAGSPTGLGSGSAFPRSAAMQCVPSRAYGGDAGARDAQGGSGVRRPESGDSFPKRHTVRKCQDRPAALHGDLA